MIILFYEGCTLDEVRAFRELEGEVFDFGEGEMKIEGWLGSEDAYYEMCLPEESGYNDEMEEYYYPKCQSKTKKKVKYKINHYTRKQIDKVKFDKLSNIGWWIVQDKGTHKIIRKAKNVGNYSNYRKLYDYWYEVF